MNRLPQSPLSYKTQRGLIRAMNKIHEECYANCSVAYWLQSAKDALIKNFGWEQDAAFKFVACYNPNKTAYFC